jgi:cytochrome c oxidase subunit 2
MASERSHRPNIAPLAAGLVAGACLAACSPQQSAIHPAGEDASGVATLFWVMTGAGAFIWLIVMGLAIYAVVGRKRPKSEWFADRFVLIGGVAFPSAVLAALLVFGLSLLPSWTADEPADVRIRVSAEQYWWRIVYERADGLLVETANEVRLPVDATAEFIIDSPDVIHSFWIPSLGGKMDAIPGRANVLRLTPTKIGTYRGVCAEFCGPSHALMAFTVEVQAAADFAAWLDAQAAPASADAAAFATAGCGACHIIRGVSEQGSVGPDLTHLASRPTIAAGTLPNTPDSLRAWLVSPSGIKPDAHMPSYSMLPAVELDALIAFLTELR